MPFYEKGTVRIRYEEAGSGFPLLVTPGGGLNSRVSNWPTAVFNSMDIFKDEFRCITMDQRNANGGESTGPIPASDPWGAFADDQLGLMDHLGIKQFLFVWWQACWYRRSDITRITPTICTTPGGTHGRRNCCRSGRTLPRRRSTRICTTFTAYGPRSFTACRETSRVPAKHRCWSCRTMYRRIRWCRPSRWRRCARTPRSRCFRGATRLN
jgi:hypothetical protein